MTAKLSTMLDRHVGQRLRTLRQARGFSQAEIGKAIGVTFQQMQKYEHGNNRISAGHLFEFAQILEVELDAFFEGLRRTCIYQGQIRPSIKPRPDPGELIRQIRDPRIRKRIVALIAALASNRGDPPDTA
jgi:transcriptional regulator with XRE-family HTH domain